MSIFIDSLMRFVGDIINNGVSVATAALWVAIIGVVIAWIAYRHQLAMTEPWAMTKVGENTWLLKRRLPRLATISGIMIKGYHAEEGELLALDFSFGNPSPEPAKYFKNGTNILINLKVPAGSNITGISFDLYYKQPRREKSPPQFSYHSDMRMGDLDVPPRGVKVWTTSLY